MWVLRELCSKTIPGRLSLKSRSSLLHGHGPTESWGGYLEAKLWGGGSGTLPFPSGSRADRTTGCSERGQPLTGLGAFRTQERKGGLEK